MLFCFRLILKSNSEKEVAVGGERPFLFGSDGLQLICNSSQVLHGSKYGVSVVSCSSLVAVLISNADKLCIKVVNSVCNACVKSAYLVSKLLFQVSGYACCLLSINGICKLLSKAHTCGQDLLLSHIQHCKSLDVDDLGVVLKNDLGSGLELGSGVDLEHLEHLDVLLISIVRNSINSGSIVGKTTLCSLFYPACIIAVAIEDDPLVLLDSLNKELVKLGGEISSAFKSVGKFIKGICNDSVEYAVCAGDGLGRTKASEFELVTCECERRSSVTVCGILGEVGVGNRVTRETNEAMQKVMTELDQIIQEVANIRTASDRQAVSVNNIKKGVEDINDVIQSNSAAAEETSATSEELSASATTLNELLEHFKLRG